MDRRERLEGDLNEAILAALIAHQAGMWTALPGKIVKINAAAMTCEVEPSIQARLRNFDGTYSWVSIPVLPDVPLVFPGGGGFTLTFPIAIGDEVLVIFASRCIDSWWASGHGDHGRVQAELRMHDLSDGFAIVGPRSQVRTLSPAPSGNAVELRSDDQSAFVRIDASHKITLTAPSEIDLNATNVNITGALNVTQKVTALDFSTSGLPSYIIHTHNMLVGGLPGHTSPPDAGT